ncbi:MAG: hypothetical protein INR71_07745, partial [Terriglobus roseus]|nr:hypothetical protein [Terriglobus roseus]
MTRAVNSCPLGEMTQFHQNSEAARLLERDREWLLPVYARFPIVMDRGEGVFLFDTS